MREKRLISMILAISMTVSLMPVSVVGEETNEFVEPFGYSNEL